MKMSDFGEYKNLLLFQKEHLLFSIIFKSMIFAGYIKFNKLLTKQYMVLLFFRKRK